MNREKILVIAHNEKLRRQLLNLLSQKGYAVYEGDNAYKALRLARQIKPDLVIIQYDIQYAELIKIGQVIEKDFISTVLFVSNKLDYNFLNQLDSMKIYAYLMVPIETKIFYGTIKFVVENSKKIRLLEERVALLEENIEKRKIIEDAKIYLIKKWNLTEEQAYKLLRKRSMDEGKSMEQIAKKMLE